MRALITRVTRLLRRRSYWVLCALTMLLIPQAQSQVYSTYAVGHISRVAFDSTAVIVMLDVGVPSNCTGTPYGWLIISSSKTPLVAFVLGLWMRGDASQKQLTVYTSGIDSTGYCQINQIDTASSG